jgi:hypothetical protein
MDHLAFVLMVDETPGILAIIEDSTPEKLEASTHQPRHGSPRRLFLPAALGQFLDAQIRKRGRWLRATIWISLYHLGFMVRGVTEGTAGGYQVSFRIELR